MAALLVAGVTTLAAYLIGAIPFGYLIARWRGVDIRKQGSGNIGATNVGRVLGRGYGILAFVLDFAKGAVPVAAALWITTHASPDIRTTLEGEPLPVAVGVAALLGHLFPVYLRFRGGKGVATAAGVVAVLLPIPTLAALVAWVAVLCIGRYVSLASLAAAVTLCIVRLGFTPEPFAPGESMLTIFCLLAAALVFVRHRSNLVRLLQGSEHRARENPAMLAATKIIHVLSLGLWFGMVSFFTFVVGLSLFHAFQSLAARDASQRPAWYPLPAMYDRNPALWDAAQGGSPLFADAEAVRREQGTRTAGAAVGPIFDSYYLLQGLCGLLAVATALGWSTGAPGNRLHRARTLVLILGVLTVVAGWPLERKVADMRRDRDKAVDAALAAPQPNHEAIAAAASAVRDFGRWHAYSLLLNFVTLGLVTAGLTMAAWLPIGPSPSRPKDVADKTKLG